MELSASFVVRVMFRLSASNLTHGKDRHDRRGDTRGWRGRLSSTDPALDQDNPPMFIKLYELFRIDSGGDGNIAVQWWLTDD
jgi:hypothetical protein